ncbi:MAG: sensor histidine kinase [Opitutaceae bacterium]
MIFRRLWLFVLLPLICQGQADNRFRQLPDLSEVGLFAIPKLVEQLSEEIDDVEGSLASLPALREPRQLEAYGYHSDYLPKLDQLPDSPRWTLDLSFNRYITLTQVIMVPAIDRRFGDSGSYGFPKRFRLLTIDNDGVEHLVEEWMDADCPDPGRYPLILEVPPPKAHRLRLEVFRGDVEGEREYFALDELFGVMGMSYHPCLELEVSSEYHSPPYWEARFVRDRQTHLGLPLDVKLENGSEGVRVDFSVVFEQAPESDCIVEIDLGENRKLGWVSLFPAQSPAGNMIPGFGFPETISMEIVRQTKTGTRGKAGWVSWDWTKVKPGNNMKSLSGSDIAGRWIRLHFDDLPIHDGKSTFAMGEIHVYRTDITYPIETIRLEGFPAVADEKVKLLHDKKAGGYPILFMLDWLHQIEQRRTLSRQLEDLQRLKANLQNRWKRFWQKAGLVLGVLILLSAVAIAVAQVIIRRRHSKRLRIQINSDLHDDIGSKVAAISLASTFVSNQAHNDLVRERGTRISRIAKDMHQGLRDVLWLTDTRTDTLAEIVQKLINCAQVSVAPESLSLKNSLVRTVSTRPVQLQPKRDILMFFKEALHNATEHSNAERISVEILCEGRQLSLQVVDDGDGFSIDDHDPKDPAHHGLWTMRLRSKRLHGQFKIESEVGKGTSVMLVVHI